VTEGQIVVIALRLLLPLLIPRFPLLGGLLAMAIDALDVVIVEWFGPGGMGDHYHTLDKLLDLYYLSLEAWVASRWANRPARVVALALFGWRVVGVALFELTGERAVLFAFPNLFEWWFIAFLVVVRFFPRHEPRTWRAVVTWLAILLVPKLGQEYLLHVAEAQPWDWVKRNLLGQ
jgi:hypothetical protein